MEKCNLTKVHCWSFAHSKGSYKPNQKVCFDQTEDSLKVISNQNFSTPGIKTCLDSMSFSIPPDNLSFSILFSKSLIGFSNSKYVYAIYCLVK